MTQTVAIASLIQSDSSVTLRFVTNSDDSYWALMYYLFEVFDSTIFSVILKVV